MNRAGDKFDEATGSRTVDGAHASTNCASI